MNPARLARLTSTFIVNLRSSTPAVLSSRKYSTPATKDTPAPQMASRSATIPQAERLFDGNMHKSDVWSIFT